MPGGDTYLQCGLSGQYCLNMGPLCKKARAAGQADRGSGLSQASSPWKVD